jgi:hypothetical protein
MGQPVSVGVTRVPRTLGILSIVFASIVLFSSLFGVVGLVVPVLLRHAPPSGGAAERQTLEMMSRMYLMMGLVSAILMVMSAALLALGIGQLRYRAWAAVWTVRWAIVALGCVIVMAILVSQMFTGGFFQMLAAKSPDAAVGARQVERMFGAVYAAMIIVFYSPYPILLAAFFSRARVRAAMSA